MIYTKDEQAVIFLSQFDFMTSKKFSDIFINFKKPEDIFNLDKQELYSLKDILGKHYEIVADSLSTFDFDKFIMPLEKRGIKVTTIYSSDYPEKLLKLKNPPYCLYYIGDLNLARSTSLAVVGSRNPTAYGKIVTEKLVKDVVKYDVTIVSGLALGIDKIAHETALENNGKTIAVLGSGFDHMFPAININTAREIAQKGLILTEYYLNVKATRYSFPNRNRIIAGLSNLILITEAKLGSGSIYTQEYGAEMGIETMCVPGNITSELSGATNALIKSGADVVTEGKDIIIKLGLNPLKKVKSKGKHNQLSLEQELIVNILREQETTYESLIEKTGLSTKILNVSLTALEIGGIIKRLAGNSFMLVNMP